MKRKWREPAAAGGDYVVMVVLAFIFLFFVLHFASNGRITELVARQFGAVAKALSGS
ncbi:MAG: hypothetical protein V1708_06595 [Candidatus Micrarchaeota archaeon]